MAYPSDDAACLVLGVPTADEERALVTVVPHTTSLRGIQIEF